jgi:UDP-glucuronate decarboxylase
MNKQPKVLIAGGAGFLGSHLCDRFLKEGYRVFCLDNLFTGNRQNISHLISLPSFEFIQHDICYPIDLEVDMICNLACPASPIHYQADPIYTTKTSVLGALNLLGLAKKLKCKIFQASTSEIYGDPYLHPQLETHWGNVNPIGTRACYDEGKRCAETLFFDYQRQHKIEIKVARIFNTYGPRMHPNDGRVVSNFIVQALQNKPLTVYGQGLQTRSFCYVDDLVEVMYLLSHAPKEISGPINIGNPIEYKVIDLAKEIIRLTGSKSTIIHHPLPLDDPRQRCPDITLAKTLLGWEPKVFLEEGLQATIAYFRGKVDLPLVEQKT